MGDAVGNQGDRHDPRRVDWDEVAVVVTESYRLLAPAKLAAAVGPSRTTQAAAPAVSHGHKRRR
jgi:hypothetical protein